MILFLLLLILAAVGVAIYANENTGTHSVNFLQWHWSSVPDWWPVVAAAVVFGGLLLLYMIYSGLVHGVRVGSMRRRVSTREQAINDMQGENQRLREENARMRAELRGIDRSRSTAPVADNPNMRREPVGATSDRGEVNDRRAVNERRDMNDTTTDRRTSVPDYRPRPSFGERVRAFFSGREPAGY